MGPLLALVSAALWGTADFGGGLLSRRLRALAVAGWSQAAAGVALLVAVVIVRPGADDGRWLGWGIAAGIAGALGLMCFYHALATGTMGVVSPIAALGALVPVLVGIAGGERPSAVQLAGMGLALAGAVAASGPEIAGAARARSVVLAAAAGVLFGLTFVAMDRGADSDALLTIAAMRMGSVPLFVVIALVAGSLGGIGRRDAPALAAVGVADAAANLCFAAAATSGLVSVVAVLGSLYPVVTVALARFVLRERLSPVQAAGVALALAGVALVSAG